MHAESHIRVSTVIVNYNSGHFLQGAVDSALRQQGVKTDVIVVDNASSDDSLDFLDSGYDQVTLVRQDKNLGFAKGCNIGTGLARGAYVLFLNPDCVLGEGALAALVDVLEEKSEASIVGPMLLNPDGSEQAGGRRDIPSPWKTFCMLLRLDALMKEHPRFKSFNHVGRETPSKPCVVESVSGACMLVRSSALARIGGFDEQYFLHFEDLELCMRMGRNKMPVMFAPQATCTHIKGGCSGKRPLFVEYHKHQSFVRFMNKGFLNYYPKIFLVLVSSLVYAHFLYVVVRSAIPFVNKLKIKDFWSRI